MKNIKALALLTASLFLAGCSTVAPLLTPAALTSEVSQGIQVGLDVSPSSTPDVALARDVICSAAQSTNVNPQMIVNDLQVLNLTNSNSKLIVDGALMIYENVWMLIGTNTTAQIEPYLTALCAGFTQGLPPVTATAKASRKLLPPHLK